MSEITDLRDKVIAQGQSLDAINTNVSGIAQDVAFLKQRIEELEGGATAEEIAELKAAIDSASEKIASITQVTGDLDSQTDSSAPTP